MYLKKGETNREKTRFRGLYALLLMNLVFNLGWSVPAWILLAAHFILKISIWWFASLLIIWFFIILLRTLLISWAGDCASVRDEPKKNLNPYSASSSSFGKADKKKKPVKRRLDPAVKRMLITAAVLLTAVALMLSAGCAKDKNRPPKHRTARPQKRR